MLYKVIREFICSFPYRLEGGQWYMRFHILFIHQTVPDVIPSFIHWHIKPAGCPADWPPPHVCFHALKVIVGSLRWEDKRIAIWGEVVAGGRPLNFSNKKFNCSATIWKPYPGGKLTHSYCPKSLRATCLPSRLACLRFRMCRIWINSTGQVLNHFSFSPWFVTIISILRVTDLLLLHTGKQKGGYNVFLVLLRENNYPMQTFF